MPACLEALLLNRDLLRLSLADRVVDRVRHMPKVNEMTQE